MTTANKTQLLNFADIETEIDDGLGEGELIKLSAGCDTKPICGFLMEAIRENITKCNKAMDMYMPAIV